MSAPGGSEMEIDAPTSKEDATPGEDSPTSSDGSPRFGTLAWIRYHWDEDRDTAPGIVLVVKFGRELPYMSVFPFLAALVVAIAFYSVGESGIRILLRGFGTFGAGFLLFWRRWWCLTLADPQNQQ